MSLRSLRTLTLGAFVLCACTTGGQTDVESGGSDPTGEGDSTDTTGETDTSDETDTGDPVDPGLPTGPLYGVTFSVEVLGADLLEVTELSSEDAEPVVVYDGSAGHLWFTERFGATYSDSLALYPVGQEDSNRIYVHDLGNAPMEPLTVLEDVPMGENHAQLSADGSTLAIYSGLAGDDELRVAAVTGDGIGPFSMVANPGADLNKAFAISPAGDWLCFGQREPDEDQIYVSELVEGVPQAPVALTALANGELAWPREFRDDAVFFTVSYAQFQRTLWYADLSTWPLVTPEPVFEINPDMASSWAIDDAGTRIVHVHNTTGELLGDVELIEINGGQVSPGQAIDTGGALVFHDKIVFSTNQRFVFLLSEAHEVLVADLESGGSPTASVLGTTNYSLDQVVYSIGDWVVWRDEDAVLKAATVTDTIGPPMSLSSEGVKVATYGSDPNRARVIYASDYGRNWIRDLSAGDRPGMPKEFPTQLAPALVTTQVALPSPLDDWMIYTSQVDFTAPSSYWGQVPGSDGAREYLGGAPRRLFAPGTAEVSSVY